MPLKLCTAQYAYRGRDRVDTTVKSSDGIFAPTWDIVMGVKKGKITEQQYTAAYYEMMRQSYTSNYAQWMDLLSRDEATIVCFCAYGQFCHRHLLKDMLVKCGAIYMGERGHIA